MVFCAEIWRRRFFKFFYFMGVETEKTKNPACMYVHMQPGTPHDVLLVGTSVKPIMSISRVRWTHINGVRCAMN